MKSVQRVMTSWHRRVLARLIYFGCVHSVLTGMLTIIVDYEHKCIVTHKSFKIYTLIINLFQLVSLPLVLFNAERYLRDFERNEFLYALGCALFVVKYFVTAFIIVMRGHRERRFVKLTKTFFQLEHRYFSKWSTDDVERRIDIVFFLKYFTTIMQSVITFMATLYVARVIDWKTVLLAVYLASMQNILLGTFFFYVTALSFVWWGFEVVNLQVARVLVSKPLPQRRHLRVSDTATQLRELTRVHLELTRTSVFISDRLRYITLCVLLIYVIQYTIYGFYTLMLLRTAKFYDSINWPVVVSVFVFYFLMLLDLFVFYWCCEAVSRAQQSTMSVLSDLQQFHRTLSGTLERQVERFALQLASRKLEINCGNMFQLNRSSALTVGAYILRNILLLVQFQNEHRTKVLNGALGPAQ